MKKSKLHPCIHASMYTSSYRFKKKIITCHGSSNHPSYSTKSLKIISKKKVTNVRHSRDVCRHFKSKIQVLLLYIRTLYEIIVIDFLMFTLRPSTRQWSSISLHQGPLRGNGHWFSYVTSTPSAKQWSWFFLNIKALYKAMVIDLFTSRPSARQWSMISLFTSRPSARQWSLISYVTSRPSTRQWSSISLNQDPLRDNGHRSL